MVDYDGDDDDEVKTEQQKAGYNTHHFWLDNRHYPPELLFRGQKDDRQKRPSNEKNE